MISEAVQRLPYKQKGVTIIGAGTGGSSTAKEFVKAKIPIANIVDPDVVSEENLKFGTALPYTFFDQGEPKVVALKKRILEKDPDAEIRTVRKRLSPNMSTQEINVILDNSPLVICAADTREVIRTLTRPAIMFSRIVIFRGLHARDGGGHVIRYSPTEDACLLHSLEWDSFDEMEESRASESNITADDIRVVAERTAEMARTILFGKRFYESIGVVTKFTTEIAEMLLLGKRFYERHQTENYLHIEKLKDGRHRTYRIKGTKNEDCILCNPAKYADEVLSQLG